MSKYRFYSCEFEFSVVDKDCVIAYPFWKGYEACVQGASMGEAYENAEALLKFLVNHYRTKDKPIPPLTKRNRPRRGGVIMDVNYSEATS